MLTHLPLILLFILASLFPQPDQSAVTLVEFYAVGEDSLITVYWTTATEIDTSGFLVHRSTNPDTGYIEVSDFYFAVGDPLTGYEYDFPDETVQNGVLYYYKLEAIDIHNNSEFFGPISATAGPPTPTATITASPTSTATLPAGITPTATRTASVSPTPTSTASAAATGSITPAPSPTSTATFTPTLTPSPAPPESLTPAGSPSASATPAHTATLTATITLTPTTTLLPLGTITLTFPSLTPTITATQPPTATPLVVTSTPSRRAIPIGQRDLARLGLIVTIGALWLLLAGWLYIIFRWKKQ